MRIAAFYDDISVGAKASGITVEAAVRGLMQEGLELIYLSGFVLDKKREMVETMLKETGVEVEGAYMFYDFGHKPEDRSFEKLIDDMASLGGTNVLLVPGFLSAKDSEEEQKRQLDNMVTALKAAVAYGQSKSIAVSMEDMDGIDAPYCSVEGLDFFMQAVPGLACSFDTGNFVIHHEDEFAALERFRDRLCTIHLKDRSYNRHFEDERATVCADGAEVFPEVVGAGFIRMEEILNRLKERGYQGNVIAELCCYSPGSMLEGLAASLRWLKERI